MCTAPDTNAPIEWLGRLSYNVQKCRQLPGYQEGINHGTPYKSSVEWNIAEEGLKLLQKLKDILIQLNSQKECHGEAPPPGLLSVNDEKHLKTLIQLISVLGIQPHLLPGVGLPLTVHKDVVVNKAEGMNNAQRAWHLHKCAHVLLQCMEERKTLRGLVVLSVLTDLLASLIQVVYVPQESDETSNGSCLPAIAPDDRVVCHLWLQSLLDKISQRDIVRELFLLQGSPSATATPSWLKEVCGNCYLSS